jgi:hypothetical protein
MTTLRNLSRHIGVLLSVSLMTVCLAGCGIAPMVAQQTTAAALAPFTTAAQATNATLQTLGRGMSAMSSQTAYTTRQLQIANANMARYQPAPRPVSYQAPPPTRAPKAYKAPKSQRDEARSDKDRTASSNEPIKPTLDILPKELLQRLSEDQAGLQRAAQGEAMTAQIGEIIFWHLDGREGSAMAESESPMGGFTCRTFVQTIALEDYFDKVSLTACRNANGAWIQSF